MIIVYNSVTHVSEHLLPFSPVYTPPRREGMYRFLLEQGLNPHPSIRTGARPEGCNPYPNI